MHWMTALPVQGQVAQWAQWELASAEQLPGVLPMRWALTCAEDPVAATHSAAGEMCQDALVRVDTSEVRLGDPDQMSGGMLHQWDLNLSIELEQACAKLQQTHSLHLVPESSVLVQDLACCAAGRAGRKALLLKPLD